MKPVIKIFLGPPGTGKTHKLIDTMETELKTVEPNKIAFLSFTKKAVKEALHRVIDRFSYKKEDLPYVCTIHSLAFRQMMIKQENVMGPTDYALIASHLGLTFSMHENVHIDELSLDKKHRGDRYLFLDGYSRASHKSVRVVWDSINHDNLNWWEFLRFQDTLAEYKRNTDKIDYSEMLTKGASPLDVEVLIIDEAQDLSTAQWYFINQVFGSVERIYIGGDDDQAIYEWSGADVSQFINMPGERIVLGQSWRIPSSVHDLAEGISSKISNRMTKPYLSKPEKGQVEYWLAPELVDITSGTWLLLARNGYMLNKLAKMTKEQGCNYTFKNGTAVNHADVSAIKLWEKYRQGATLSDDERTLLDEYVTDYTDTRIWHEAFTKMEPVDIEFYVSLLRRGESLTKTPRITISTIHGAKGGEAEHVLLLTDMSATTHDASTFNPDAEHRVWYVGATRCKQSLNIIMPQGRYSYDI